VSDSLWVGERDPAGADVRHDPSIGEEKEKINGLKLKPFPADRSCMTHMERTNAQLRAAMIVAGNCQVELRPSNDTFTACSRGDGRQPKVPTAGQ
jgi:hypothetical protein